MAGKAFGFELGKLRLGTVPFTAKNRQALDVAQGIPKDYFLFGLVMRLQFRLGISGGTTNGTPFAEAGQSLIEQMEISGNHKVYGDLVRTRLAGFHVYQMGNIRGGYLHERTVSIAAATPVQLAPNGINAQYTGAATLSGAIANYDMSITYEYHLAPPRVRTVEQLMFLLDPPFWNSLNLFIDWGDATNLINGGDRTLALTSFGSATGIPSLVIWRIIAKLKGDRYKVNPIPIKETFLSILATVSQTDTLVTNLNVGNFIRSIHLVTGTVSAAGQAKVGDNFLTEQGYIGSNGQTAGGTIGNTPFFSRIKVKKYDILLRDLEWVPLQEYEGDAKDQSLFTTPAGWACLEFSEGVTGTTVGNAMDTRQIALQNLKFTLEGDITGAANQRVHVIHTELAGIS